METSRAPPHHPIIGVKSDGTPVIPISIERSDRAVVSTPVTALAALSLCMTDDSNSILSAANSETSSLNMQSDNHASMSTTTDTTSDSATEPGNPDPSDSNLPADDDVPFSVNDIPLKTKNNLRVHLDTGTDCTWEMLAEELGVPALDILWMRSRSEMSGNRNGPTLWLLERCSSRVTIPQLIAALKTIGNLAALDVMSRCYDELKNEYYKKKKSRSQPPRHSERMNDSRPIESRRVPPDYGSGGAQLSLSSVQSYAAPTPSTMALRSPATSLSTGSSANACSLRSSSLPVDSHGSGSRRMRILLTCAADADSDCREIQDSLRQKHFDIIFGSSHEEQLQPFSVERCFNEVDFVIVVMSPGYKLAIDSVSGQTGSTGFRQIGNTDKLLQLIYRMMHAEYNRNFANRRFIPLILKLRSRSSDLPWWLQDTIAYAWPVDKPKLLRFFATKQPGRSTTTNS